MRKRLQTKHGTRVESEGNYNVFVQITNGEKCIRVYALLLYFCLLNTRLFCFFAAYYSVERLVCLRIGEVFLQHLN